MGGEAAEAPGLGIAGAVGSNFLASEDDDPYQVLLVKPSDAGPPDRGAHEAFDVVDVVQRDRERNNDSPTSFVAAGTWVVRRIARAIC